jgi:vomeronasal 2 receptor
LLFIFVPKCYVILLKSGGHSRKKFFKWLSP